MKHILLKKALLGALVFGLGTQAFAKLTIQTIINDSFVASEPVLGADRVKALQDTLKVYIAGKELPYGGSLQHIETDAQNQLGFEIRVAPSGDGDSMLTTFRKKVKLEGTLGLMESVINLYLEACAAVPQALRSPSKPFTIRFKHTVAANTTTVNMATVIHTLVSRVMSHIMLGDTNLLMKADIDHIDLLV